MIKKAINTKEEEGFRAKEYKDTKGKRTIGHGFNLEDPVTASMLPKETIKTGTISKEDSEVAYNKRMKLAEKDARQYLGDAYDKLDDNRKGVVNDLSYNIGLTKLMKFVNLKDAITKQDFKRAAKEIMNSKYAKDVPERAKRNSEIMGGAMNELETELKRQIRR